MDNGRNFSPRTGCALPAVGSATAVTVGGVMATVPQGSSFIWPSFMVIIMLRNIWRGESYRYEMEVVVPGSSREAPPGR